MGRRDWAGAALLGVWLAGLLAYRAVYVEPRAWGAVCAAAAPPWACLPRAGLLWMQEYGVWGGAALVLGIGAFAGLPLTLWAIGFGIAGVVNYNASFGVLGAAIGFWAWLSPAARPPTPAAAHSPTISSTGG